MGMTPGHIFELLTPEARCHFCQHLTCVTCPIHKDAVAHQGLETCPSGPHSQFKHQSWVFQFFKLLALLKACLGVQAGCPETSCPALSFGKVSVLPALPCCHEFHSLCFDGDQEFNSVFLWGGQKIEEEEREDKEGA